MATVYFTDVRTRPGRSLLDKIEGLLKRVKAEKRMKKNDLTAIKVHFGEQGNCAFIRPVMVRVVVDHMKALGCRPFLTDANTLYKGSRSDAVAHIETAVRNGFDYAVVGCPVIIADGVRGKSGVKVPIEGGAFDRGEHRPRDRGGGLPCRGEPFQGARTVRLRRDPEEYRHGLRGKGREAHPAQHGRPRDQHGEVQRLRALHQLLPRGRHRARRQEGHDRGAQMHRLRRMHPGLSSRRPAGAVE